MIKKNYKVSKEYTSLKKEIEKYFKKNQVENTELENQLRKYTKEANNNEIKLITNILQRGNLIEEMKVKIGYVMCE